MMASTRNTESDCKSKGFSFWLFDAFIALLAAAVFFYALISLMNIRSQATEPVRGEPVYLGNVEYFDQERH